MSLTTQTEWSIFDAETCSIPSFCYFQKNPLLNDLQISTWSKPSRTILRQLENKFIEVILGGRVFLHIGHSIAQYEGKLSTDSEKGNFSSPTQTYQLLCCLFLVYSIPQQNPFSIWFDWRTDWWYISKANEISTQTVSTCSFWFPSKWSNFCDPTIRSK